MLQVEKLCSSYGRIRVLYDVSIQIQRGEIVALIGSNGAGKTTFLRAISGIQPITSGDIRYEGRAITSLSAAKRVALGLSQVPEGRQVFSTLTVEENLRLGAYLRTDPEIGSDIERAYEMFPILREKKHQDAGNLSGGQQQMLAVARAIMARPNLILLDEPSLGLAPLIIKQIFDAISRLRDEEGMTCLLVDQNAHAALGIADRAYVLEVGAISHAGTSAELLNDPRISDLYLGSQTDSVKVA